MHVLELVAPCFCANFSRLSNLDGMCQANRLTSLILTPHSRMIRDSPVWRIRKAPNFERPDREQNSWGRLAAQLGISQGKVRPDSRVAMDCSVGLPCARGATTVEQIRFALQHNRGKNTLQRSLATATNLLYLTMPGCDCANRLGKATS